METNATGRSDNRVRQARERGGVTQLELAHRSGLSLGTICAAERGARLTRRTAEKLADALGVTPAELLGEVALPLPLVRPTGPSFLSATAHATRGS